MAGPAVTFRVTGLQEFRNSLKRADGETAKFLKRSAADLGHEMEEVAKAAAVEQGFAAPGRSGRGTGALLREIYGRSSNVAGNFYVARLDEKAVREEGKNAPFRYPAVYEFGKGRRHRPFLRPAYDLAIVKSEEMYAEAIRRALAASKLL